MKTSTIALTAAALTLTFAACDQQTSTPAPTTPPAEPTTATPAPAPAAESAATAEAPPAAPAGDAKEAFAASLNAIGEEMSTATKEAEASGNPMAMLKKLPDLLAKMDKISLDGLPENLTTAFEKFKSANKAIADVMAKIPEDFPLADQSKIPDYIKSHPNALGTLQDLGKMGDLSAASNAAQQALSEAATENGLDLSAFLKAGAN